MKPLIAYRRMLCSLFTVLLLGWPSPASRAEESPKVVTCFINHTWYPVNSFEGIIPDEITRRTGITLDVTIAHDERQLSQLIAQGNLPDIIFTSTMLERLNDPTLCYSYDELLETYQIDWELPAQLRANALTYSSDGQVYALLNNYASNEDWQQTSAVPMISSLVVRQDILDEMGVSDIRTTDALMDVFMQVHEQYPDMVPLTFDINHRFNIFRCYFGMGILPFLAQEDGTQLFYSRDERYHAMLVYLNRLYRSGCMITDSFAASSADSSYLFKAGRSFAYSTCTQNPNLTLSNALTKINPGYQSVELYPLEGSCFDTQGLGWSGTFISRNAKDPETCMRLIAWMYSDEGQYLTEWGREGVDYTLDDNGLPIFSDDVMRSVADNTYNTAYNPWFYFGTSAVVESEGRCALQRDFLPVETYDAIRCQYRIYPWIAAAIAHMPIDIRVIYERLTNSMPEYETKIILSADDASFERNFDVMLTYLEVMEVARLESWMTNAIPQEYESYHQCMEDVTAP